MPQYRGYRAALAPTVYASWGMLPLPMQDSLPAGWLASTGRESNPLDRVERFPSCYISSPFPGFILTLAYFVPDSDLSMRSILVDLRGPIPSTEPVRGNLEITADTSGEVSEFHGAVELIGD